jgi:UDP-glucose 4-epimerase
MTHFLVTGGAGFIGSHLVESLIAQGNQVTVLDDLSSGKRGNLPRAARLIVGSICDPEAVRVAMEGDVDGCFHLAAIPSVTQSIEQWTHSHQVNQGGTVRIFEAAAAKSLPVVYASSAAVYGDNPTLPLHENAMTNPASPYGLDKLVCEWQAKIGAECRGLCSIGLRFFNVYGERQDPKSPYSGVISIFMERLKEKKDLQIFGDGLQSRDFIYVGDVVKHLQAAMQGLCRKDRDSKDTYPKDTYQKDTVFDVFNVCTNKSTSVNELATLLMDVSDCRGKIIHLPERSGDIRHSLGDNTKAKTHLRQEATQGLKEGLQRVWRDF